MVSESPEAGEAQETAARAAINSAASAGKQQSRRVFIKNPGISLYGLPATGERFRAI
jgi:hypothetical protein